ncbi:hypothetical protein BKA69DRAFT_1061227 [Paraphysoderma sedebokerense]|nr:hypothetical protein BKA69DRAFT_1061227 [Paraphysoderma sedebokerense]
MIYLVDSILKNVGHPYISLFSHVITTLFRSAYTSVTESSAKKSMERVLQTWKVPPPVMGADGKPFQHKGSFFPLTSIEEMERLVKGSNSTQASVGVVNGVSNTRTVSPLLANSSLSQMPLSTNPHSTSIVNQSSIPLTAYSATYPTHTYQPSTTLLSSLSFSSQPQLSESQLLLADIQNLIFQKQQHQLLNPGDTNNLSQIGALTQVCSCFFGDTFSIQPPLLPAN